jgi:hypothetical protein
MRVVEQLELSNSVENSSSAPSNHAKETGCPRRQLVSQSSQTYFTLWI